MNDPVFQSFISIFTSPFRHFNWLDYLICIIFLLYAFEGASIGFISGFFDLISFIFSFVLGLKFYAYVGQLLTNIFNISIGFSNAIGFFLIAFISEVFFRIIIQMVHRYLQIRARNNEGNEDQDKSVTGLQIIDHFFGLIPGVISAYIFLAFVITLIVSLPVSPFLKHSVSQSQFGTAFVARTQLIEKNINSIFGGAVHETLSFLTVEPQSNETVDLHFKTTDVSYDTNAEKQMFAMVNQERLSRGIPELVFDNKLQDVGRAHGKDMFARGYFSHYTPEGLNPFDRMTRGNVQFTAAGENLAFAPNVALAMEGLMQSPGHKANILSTDFGKVGIGVVDGGIYGEIFVQEFTN